MTDTTTARYGWNIDSAVYHYLPERRRAFPDGSVETLCGKAHVRETADAAGLDLDRRPCRHCQVAAGERPGPPQRRPADSAPPGYALAAADVAEMDPELLATWLDTLAADPVAFSPDTVAALASAAVDLIRRRGGEDEAADPDGPLSAAELAEVDALVAAVHRHYGAIPGGRAAFLAEPGGWLDYLGVVTELRLPDEWEDRISLAAIERIQGEWQSGLSSCRRCRRAIRYHAPTLPHERVWLHVEDGLRYCQGIDDTLAEPPEWYVELPREDPAKPTAAEFDQLRADVASCRGDDPPAG